MSSRINFTVRVILSITFIFAFLLITNQDVSSATIFVVNSPLDAVDVEPGNGTCATSTAVCTLRAAIQEANALIGTDTVQLDTGMYELTIGGTGEDASATGDFDITEDLIILGNETTPPTINGFSNDRVFHILPSVTVNMSDLQIQSGDPSPDLYGGGVYNQGTLVLNNVTVHSNYASDSGGGIYNAGDLTITNSIISDNDASSGYGGGLYNVGTATLDTVTFVGNSCILGSGGGIENDLGSTLEIENSTLVSNSAGDYGGAIDTFGSLSITSSTISGNDAQVDGGGIYVGDDIVTLSNVTITNNSADSNLSGLGEGGGIYNGGGEVRLQNTILSGNIRPIVGPDCDGILNSWGYNLIEHGSPYCVVLGDPTGNVYGQPALLGPLGDNGGPTDTHALLPGSKAIDGGNPSGCMDHLGSPLTADQRGYAYVGTCDKGAFEYQGEIHSVFLPCIIHDYCDPIFSDDFSDPASGWPDQDTGIVLWEYTGGEYRILLRTSGWWDGARPGFMASDYRVSVDVRNASGTYGTYGLMFGLSDDWSEFYTFEIDHTGYYAIWIYDAETWSIIADGWSGLIKQGSATNRIQIVRDGSTIDAYVNGYMVTSITDSTYLGSRYVGVMAYAYELPNVDVRFDNFQVYPLTCGGEPVSTIQENPYGTPGAYGSRSDRKPLGEAIER
ncbi:MAG: hypothetical protein GTO18_13680 [Anaerolineales bacterium]|nr:hypothetical protein [Anaerolineales bacterium]